MSWEEGVRYKGFSLRVDFYRKSQTFVITPHPTPRVEHVRTSVEIRLSESSVYGEWTVHCVLLPETQENVVTSVHYLD